MLDYQTDGVMEEGSADEYGSGDGERMQLNPSSDFYDEEDDDDEDGDYYVGEDKVLDDDEEKPEQLPEAKSLVQLPGGTRTVIAAMDEEEDMGYDEDDERYAAAAMERPKSNRDFMNEEGSGGGSSRRPYTGYQSYNYNKDQRMGTTYLGGGGSRPAADRRDEVVARESSGNFANDDEDDDEDDDDDGIDDGDGYYNAKRTNGGGGGSPGGGARYFRKNTNDAIKIVSTPLGKVGIVYQQTPDETGSAASAAADNAGGSGSGKKKPVSTFTDFDALSPDPESSSRRLQSSHPKITPVLTADGKVALLYRGDSESSKYEPIRNVTHKFAGGTETSSNNNKKTSKHDDEQDQDSLDSDSTGDEDDDMVVAGVGNAGEDKKAGLGSDVGSDDGTGSATGANSMPGMPVFSPVVPTGGPFILRHPTDSVLPMINRPLSEVLGIKKNQYTHIRIRDGAAEAAAAAAAAAAGGTSSTEANMAIPPRTLATGGISPEQSTNTLHFLTNKVNLADYPTSARTRNFDFDFSRDNTMLDERTRQKNQQELQQQTEQNTVANEELLAKTEVVNLAIIPHFDEDLERLQRLHEHETRRHHRQRHHRHNSKATSNDEDLSGIHCIMQAMMGVAAISTVFGMLGTFFKQRILDQLRLLHW